MPTYYYLGLPIQTPFQVSSSRRAFEVETLSLKRSVLLTEAQRWELSFNVITNGNESDLVQGHSWEYFNKKTMIMPQLPNVYKSYSFNGSLAATSTAAAGQDTVVATSSGMTGTGTIPKGTFIKFAGHEKVYVTKTTVSFTDGATNIQLKVFPNLVMSVPAAQVVQLDSNCLFSYRLDLTAVSGLNIDGGFITNPGTIKLVEAL